MNVVTIPISDAILFAVKKDVENIQNDFVSLLSRNNIDIYQYANEELDKKFDLVDKISEGIY